MTRRFLFQLLLPVGLAVALLEPTVYRGQSLGGAAPNPIPTIVNFPGSGADLSLITDFQGTVGVAHLTGTGTGTDTTTGLATTGLAFDADVRFMKGTYIGVDGQTHFGTFAFIWLDIFQPGPGETPSDGTASRPSNQIHEYHVQIPGSSVFWAVQIPDASVTARLGGVSTLHLANFPIVDFSNLINALNNGSDYPGNGVPAAISLDIRWPVLDHFKDAANTWSATLLAGKATIQVSVNQAATSPTSSDGFQFVSDPTDVSGLVRSPILDAGNLPNEYTIVELERNGAFFR